MMRSRCAARGKVRDFHFRASFRNARRTDGARSCPAWLVVPHGPGRGIRWWKGRKPSGALHGRKLRRENKRSKLAVHPTTAMQAHSFTDPEGGGRTQRQDGPGMAYEKEGAEAPLPGRPCGHLFDEGGSA